MSIRTKACTCKYTDSLEGDAQDINHGSSDSDTSKVCRRAYPSEVFPTSASGCNLIRVQNISESKRRFHSEDGEKKSIKNVYIF